MTSLRINFILVTMILFKVGFHAIGAEYFSSIIGLENLLYTERMLMRNMRSYISMTRQQLVVMESALERIESEHELADRNGMEDYLTSPVNVFRLMKRLNTDWQEYDKRIQQNHAGAYFSQRALLIRHMLSMPHQEDVDGSAIALVRLQETYALDLVDVAAGVLNGVKYGVDMNWHDCYSLGQLLYKIGFYNQTKNWLRHSMHLLRQESFGGESFSLDFIERVAERLLELGDLEEARKLSQHVLQIESGRSKASGVQQKLKEWKSGDFEVTDSAFGNDSYHATEEYQLYIKVCRGEVKPTATQSRPLRCRYTSHGRPARILAPFKLEELNLDPLMFTIHNVVNYERKIETLKQMAIPQMQRSTVATAQVNGTATSHVRISKQAWLPHHRHEYMQDMLREVHDATGLDMSHAEQLQVANYGIGGHYEPHWDFAIKTANLGNRIATAIFYFSDVEQGGATAFPFLGVSVKPIKGSMLFWYNLHRSGEPDYRTKHAACPVLKGSKWIASIWIRELAQTFKRPCALKRDGAISLQFKRVN